MSAHTMAFVAAAVSFVSLGCAGMTTLMLREQNRELKQVLKRLYENEARL